LTRRCLDSSSGDITGIVTLGFAAGLLAFAFATSFRPDAAALDWTPPAYLYHHYNVCSHSTAKCKYKRKNCWPMSAELMPCQQQKHSET